jgi:hypothetical protein
MSRAEVIEFLKGFAHRDIASVWRPGLDDWKPATQLSDIVLSERVVDPADKVSCKRRYSLYGLYVGVTVNLADYLFEWRGAKFETWRGTDLANNFGYIIGTIASSVAVAFLIGVMVDAWRIRSSKKSVLDPSTFEVPEVIPEHPLDPSRHNNFVARQWRGEYSLGASYWWFGFLGNLAVGLVAATLAAFFQAERGFDPKAILCTIVSVWLASGLVTLWQTVGVWRSANRHITRRKLIGKRSPWAGLAKIAVVLAVFKLIASFASSGLPQLVETSRMAFLGDPDIPAYSIRVMRNGTEAEITGGFKYGLTDDFSKILKASRQIKVVHLDSLGGRVGDAIRLHTLLRTQGVDTYVASGCYSACTIAFAAGRSRFIAKGATLGFHAPAFPGMSKEELDAASQDQKQIFMESGFKKNFIDKALSTPSSDVWTPSAEIMATADVITGISNGADFAISGFGSDVSKERIALFFVKNVPLLQSLKDRFPKKYDEIIGPYYEDFIAGKTEAEAGMHARKTINATIAALRPLADDEVLVEIGSAYADEYSALGAESPTLCYQYASGIATREDFPADLPPDLLARENDLSRRIIETARGRQKVSPEVVSDLWKKLGAQLGSKGVGVEQIKLLTGDKIAAPKYAEYCAVSVMMYREISKMPEREAAIVMRQMFAELNH